jgi:catechol 2,3-dioxygenase-like lactoylglutathione lyase family enzyme
MSRSSPAAIVVGLLFLVCAPSSVLAQGAESEPAHFHHVHLNVVDRAKTLAYYERLLGAVEVSYRDREPALFVERSFLLLNEVEKPAPAAPTTVVQHIGWAGVDGPNEFAWFESQEVEFQTPIGQLGGNYGWYMAGPDEELVEIWTGGQHHRFDHVHLWATDVEASSNWFRDHLGLTPRVLPKPTTQDRESIQSIHMSFIQCDNVNIVFFGVPSFDSVWFPGANYTRSDAGEDFPQPTRGHVVDHIGFSYRDIDPVFERIRDAGVEIAEPIATRPAGMRSFFVWAPDGLLVEIVEEKPLPQGVWE